jgi:eukaryotic-like serine/threonine-protein kinase
MSQPITQPAITTMADQSEPTEATESVAGSPGAWAGTSAIMSLLGDFRLLREIGRGGMGIVYEAEQVSLRRRVALKVLPFAATFDSRQKQRFQLEAQAAACLHHTHIVPIHAVGTDRGVPYYAMEFIEGCSLAAVLVELRSRRGPPVSSTDPGVLGTDSPTVDYGPRTNPTLRTAPPAETPSPPSPRGAFKPDSRSTPRDPHYIDAMVRLGVQAAEALDHAHQRGVLHRDIKPANLLVDDHGELWITDFGLAQIQGDQSISESGSIAGTLRYMSPEQTQGRSVLLDGRTDIYSLGVTLYELLTLEPALDDPNRSELLRKIAHDEPIPLRRLNSAVPADLETIIHKAMAKEPKDRYTTAQNMADDLRRFLENRPITARRPTLAERGRKWCKRHRPLVATAIIGLLASVICLAVSTALVWRARGEAIAQKRLAEQRYELARRAIDELYDETARKWLSSEIQLAPMPSQFLKRALPFYRQFAEDQGRDRTGILNAGRAMLRVGEIELQLGRLQSVRISPGSYGGEATLRRAEKIFQDLLSAFPPDLEAQHNLALCHLRLGQTLFTEEACRQAVTSFEALVRENPRNTTDLRHLGYSLHLLGVWHWNHRPEEAEAYLSRALAIQERLVDAEPEELDRRRALGQTLRDLGNLRRDTAHLDQALPYYHRAMATHETLVKHMPSFPGFRLNLAWDCWEQGKLMFRQGRYDEAAQLEIRAVVLLQGLAAEYPDADSYRWYLGESISQLSVALMRAGLAPAIETSLAQIEGDRAPSSRDAAVSRPSAPARPEGKSSAAQQERVWRRAISLLEMAPPSDQLASNLAHAHGGLAALLRALGRSGEAEQEVTSAGRIFARVLESRAIALERDQEGAWPMDHYAFSLAIAPAPRQRDLSRALILAKKSVERAPDEHAYRNTLGAIEYRLGRWDAAISDLEESLAFDGYRRFACYDWIFLAMARWQRGETDQARTCYGRAVAGINQMVPEYSWESPRLWEMEALRAEAEDLMRLPPTTNKTAR